MHKSLPICFFSLGHVLHLPQVVSLADNLGIQPTEQNNVINNYDFNWEYLLDTELESDNGSESGSD